MIRRIYFNLAILFVMFLHQECMAQLSHKQIIKDYKGIVGLWQGSLTYLDYSSNKEYLIPLQMEVKRILKSDTFTLAYFYTDEPFENSIDTVIISYDGKMINNIPIKKRYKDDNGKITIVIEQIGQDGNDNKKAIKRNSYILSKSIYRDLKEVQYENESKWIMRNEYKLKRIKK